jgi:alkaline phosphatase D
MSSSVARWKLWGNALPLFPMRVDLSALPFSGFQDSILQIDAWAGYPYEVSYLMQYLQQQEITGVVSLSGDHHMHGAGTVSHSASDPKAAPVCVDFTVAGISSSSLFEELALIAERGHPDFQPIVYSQSSDGLTPVWNMSMLDGVLAAYTYTKSGMETLARWLGPNKSNPGLKYVDTAANGYGLASFDAGELRVQMVTMEDSRSDFTEAPAVRHIAHFTLPKWQPGEQPELLGPEFDGGAPFPFTPPSV